jgi:multiple sugar transport system substrate-binding protein
MSRSRLAPLSALIAVVVLGLVAAGTSGAAHKQHKDAGNVVFLSTQLNAITESEAFRNVRVTGFPGNVQKIDVPRGNSTFFFDRVKAESAAGKGTISLLGGLHGDFSVIPDYLANISDVATSLQAAGIPKDLLTLGKMGTNKQLYIPWMQATYIMVANKKALTDLPKGADLKALTYAQLLQWAKKIKQHYCPPELGFPAGPTGLFPRYLEGYLVPAFSGRVNTGFKSKWSVAGWLYMKSLWKYVHPQSLTYNFMQDPLQSGEVLVAWDHVARIGDAFRNHPSDYVAFPAPRGPKGRAYMPVLAGLAIPKTAPNVSGAKQLIKWLDGISAQARTLSTEGFFPVVSQKLSQRLGPGLLKIAGAVKLQQRAKDALPSLLPVGLGGQGGNYNRVFQDTFTRIVINNEDVTTVINDEAQKLQAVLDAAQAPCWKPDPPSKGTCQVGAGG